MIDDSIVSLLKKYGLTDSFIESSIQEYNQKLTEAIGVEALITVGEEKVEEVKQLAQQQNITLIEAIYQSLINDGDKFSVLVSNIQNIHTNLIEQLFVKLLKDLPEEKASAVMDEVSRYTYTSLTPSVGAPQFATV